MAEMGRRSNCSVAGATCRRPVSAQAEGGRTMPPQHFRSIWISDLHLGTRSLKNEQVLDFLLRTDSDFLYLVGDIFDLVQANQAWHWPAVNDRIVQTLLAKAE